MVIPMSISRSKQIGLTLLEILIALSIFAMIGVTSFRLLDAAVSTENVNASSSSKLASIQKTMSILNRDIQYFAQRPIREGDVMKGAMVINQHYPIEFTRAAWRNPLLLERSQLQRVAYSIGPHPLSKDNESRFYNSDSQYLLRHYWQHLDRQDAEQGIYTQVLMADISVLDVRVITDKAIHTQWPQDQVNTSQEPELLKGVEFTFDHDSLGKIKRVYRLN